MPAELPFANWRLDNYREFGLSQWEDLHCVLTNWTAGGSSTVFFFRGLATSTVHSCLQRAQLVWPQATNSPGRALLLLDHDTGPACAACIITITHLLLSRMRQSADPKRGSAALRSSSKRAQNLSQIALLRSATAVQLQTHSAVLGGGSPQVRVTVAVASWAGGAPVCGQRFTQTAAFPRSFKWPRVFKASRITSRAASTQCKHTFPAVCTIHRDHKHQLYLLRHLDITKIAYMIVNAFPFAPCQRHPINSMDFAQTEAHARGRHESSPLSATPGQNGSGGEQSLV